MDDEEEERGRLGDDGGADEAAGSSKQSRAGTNRAVLWAWKGKME